MSLAGLTARDDTHGPVFRAETSVGARAAWDKTSDVPRWPPAGSALVNTRIGPALWALSLAGLVADPVERAPSLREWRGNGERRDDAG